MFFVNTIYFIVQTWTYKNLINNLYDEDDDDNPKNYVLYSKYECKYRQANFKPPRQTFWIGMGVIMRCVFL